MMQQLHIVVVAGALLGAAACSTPRSPAPKTTGSVPGQPQREPALHLSGKVIRVNASQSYVIVECAVLPRAGEEATVWRNEREVGRLRFTGPVTFPYAAADVIAGLPMVGDRIKE